MADPSLTAIIASMTRLEDDMQALRTEYLESREAWQAERASLVARLDEETEKNLKSESRHSRLLDSQSSDKTVVASLRRLVEDQNKKIDVLDRKDKRNAQAIRTLEARITVYERNRRAVKDIVTPAVV